MTLPGGRATEAIELPRFAVQPSTSLDDDPDGSTGEQVIDGANGVRVATREAVLIVPELRAFIESLTTNERRTAYQNLIKAIDTGNVDGDEIALLETFLEIGLSTGRFRQRLGLASEESIRRVFERTPRGAAQRGSADEVTRALAGLVGQNLENLRLTLVRPGTYRLVIETERCRVSVGLAPAGAHVESVEMSV